MDAEIIRQTFRRQIEQIVSLTDDEFEYAFSFFGVRQYRKHQYIVQAGDSAPYDHFVVDGLVKAFYIDEGGRSHVMQFGMEAWWISDANSFHNGELATFNIDCIEDTTVLYISLPEREKLCAELQKMEYFFLKKTAAGYVALQRRILALLSKSAEERYRQFIQMYPAMQQRLSKVLIASYLGVSRETLSRLSGA